MFNGERTLSAAIESILRQSYRDFVLIISDNCSTDSTPEICRQFSEIDPRVRYYRQPFNKGAEENFRIVLELAESEYFMWAASDDVRSYNFIEVNLTFLQINHDYVSSISPTRFENGIFDPSFMGDFSLDDDSSETRFIRFFSSWHANGRFYGLHRRSCLLDSYAYIRPILGSDWIVVLRMCMYGKMHRHEEGWISLGAHGASKRDIFSAYRTRWQQWLFPLADLFEESRYLSYDFRFLSKFIIFSKIFILNSKVACVQISQLALKLFFISGKIAIRKPWSWPPDFR